MAVLKKAGEVDRFAANMYVSTAYRFEDPGPVADYGLKTLERWPNDASLSYQPRAAAMMCCSFSSS